MGTNDYIEINLLYNGTSDNLNYFKKSLENKINYDINHGDTYFYGVDFSANEIHIHVNTEFYNNVINRFNKYIFEIKNSNLIDLFFNTDIYDDTEYSNFFKYTIYKNNKIIEENNFKVFNIDNIIYEEIISIYKKFIDVKKELFLINDENLDEDLDREKYFEKWQLVKQTNNILEILKIFKNNS